MMNIMRLLLAFLLAFAGPAAAQVTSYSGATAINGPSTIGATTRVTLGRFGAIDTSNNPTHTTGTVTISNLVLTSPTITASSTGAMVTLQPEVDIYGTSTPGAGAHWVAIKPYVQQVAASALALVNVSQPTFSSAAGSTIDKVYGTVAYLAYIGGTAAEFVANSDGTTTLNGPGVVTKWVANRCEARALTGGATIGSTICLENQNSAGSIVTAGIITGYNTNDSIWIVPKGTGGVLAAKADSTAVGGNARGNNAVDLQTARGAATQVASGTTAVIVGGTNNTASGNYTVAGGNASQAIGLYAVALGNTNIANAVGSVALGQQTQTYGSYAIGVGYLGFDFGRYGTLFQASGYGSASRPGLPQTSVATLRQRTTTAATVTLTTDQAAAGSANVLNLTTVSAQVHRGIVIAQVAGTAMKAWDVICTGRKAANNASTNLNSSTVTAIAGGDASLSTASVACVVDTTNGALLVQGTGIAATTIDWSYHPMIGEIGS